jgi:hypothetical protein
MHALKRARTEGLNPPLASEVLQFLEPADGNNAAVNWRGYGTSGWQLNYQGYITNRVVRKGQGAMNGFMARG